MTPTAERLRELLSYDPETGALVWRVPKGSRAKVGDVAGYIDIRYGYGYRRIRIDGHTYQAHRLACLYMTGAWPRSDLDHINCDRADNRWCNLREATPAQNLANSRLLGSNTSGFKGVSWIKRRNKWQAQIKTNGRAIHFGRFDTPERAFIAYVFAAWKHYGDFARIDADYLAAMRQRKAHGGRVLRNLADLSIYARAA